jgi:DNA-binding CsgD family transcriptional regulator
MKQSNALAYLRQLCCLQLPKEVVLGEFLRSVHSVIPSENNVYTPLDPLGFPTIPITDVFMPEILEVARVVLPHFIIHHLAKIDYKAHPIVDDPNMIGDNFYRSELYNLLWRPASQHHMMLAHIEINKMLVGRLFLYRPKTGKAFNSAEHVLFLQLLPYVVHAVNQPPQLPVEYELSGDAGLIVADSKGQIIYLTHRAKLLLLQANQQDNQGFVFNSIKLPPCLLRLCQNLEAIFANKNAPPPVVTHNNVFGRFVFRAYWLEHQGNEPGNLIGITIEHHEPQQLKIFRTLRDLPLSPVQKEVAMMLANGESSEKIGERLHIKYTTVKDHIRKIFDKLDIHRREELLPRLRALEKSQALSNEDFRFMG